MDSPVHGSLMLCLSFNTRGLGSSPKLNALKRMITSIKPLVILLQEAMLEGTKEIKILEIWLKNLSFAYISSEGCSGGLLTAWSPELLEIKIERYGTVLKIVLEDKNSGGTFTLFNVYGPYQNRRNFWESFFS